MAEGGQVLWRIESDQTKDLSEIRYGVVPVGFEQTWPPQGLPPRAFKLGERLHTETVTKTRTFWHDGVATGPAAFRGEGWRSNPHATPVGRMGT